MKRLIHFLRNSVRGRLAFLVIAITAPAMLLVGLLVFQAYRNEQRAVGEHLIATARAISLVVDGQIGRSESLLKGLAASSDLARGDLVAFQQFAESAMNGRAGWVILADANGRRLASTGSAATTWLPHGTLNPEHQAAISEGRTYVSNLLAVVTDRLRHLVYVAVPVMEAGRLKYTLSHVLAPSSFTIALHAGRSSPGNVVTVIDRAGTIVVRRPNGDAYTGVSAMRDIVDATRTRAEGSHASVTLEGQHVLAVYSRAPLSGWSVAMGVPFSALQASAQRLLWPGLATAALLLGVAILMAAWIGRALVRGVDTLVSDAEKIGTGVVPPVRSSGLAETDFVAEAMRKSALRLKERDDENAELAAVLKAELEQKRRSEESSRRLASIVESSEDAIVSKNLEGIITSWNQSAERLFGYAAEEVIGRPRS
jgi:PAS domain-containing protein